MRIEELRNLVKSSSFLQVTATPYSLYLQPEEEIRRNGAALFQPKRPAFTELLPKHPYYVGGEYYFEESSDPGSTAYYVYEEVPQAERDILKQSDRRTLRLEDVLEEKSVAVLRRALVNFVLGAGIRRLQEQSSGRKPQKYAFLFHTEYARGSHAWQEEVASEIRDQMVAAAHNNEPLLRVLLLASYQDLEPSIRVGSETLPTFDECLEAVRGALTQGYMMITRVNSDKDVEELLDDRGQLKLRTPMNVFIGGQILDRGLTIDNLIGFYYGRNP